MVVFILSVTLALQLKSLLLLDLLLLKGQGIRLAFHRLLSLALLALLFGFVASLFLFQQLRHKVVCVRRSGQRC